MVSRAARAARVAAAVDGGRVVAGARWRRQDALVRILATLVLAGVLLGSPGAAQAALSWSAPVSIDQQGLITSVACPSASRCVAVDENGDEVTFDPASPGSPTPVAIDTGNSFDSVACPSLSQCTAVDYQGNELTFDPASPGSPTPVSIDGAAGLDAVACPSLSQCTTVDDQGNELTFDPTSPGSPTPVSIDGAARLDAVACPSLSQCTTVDDNGNELTFDPTSPGSPTPVAIDTGRTLDTVACPTLWQCTTVDIQGDEVTAAPSAPQDNSPPTITGTAQQAKTLSETHGTWTETPTSYSYQWEDCDIAATKCFPIPRATGQTYTLSASEVGRTIRVLESATSEGVAGAAATSGATAVVVASAPSSLISPLITGNATQGQTLTETHGTWAGSPTSYGYQWEDCESSITNCVPITGGTAQTYTLTAIDVGQSIRLMVSAANAGGSATATSQPTATVQPTTTVEPTAPLTPRATCLGPTGQLRGIRLGPLALGLTRSQAQHALPRFVQPTHHFEKFCLHAGPGIRVAYSSPHLLASLPVALRSVASGRIVLALTANSYYALRAARPGMRVATVKTRLNLARPFHIGVNYWYITPGTTSNGVIKVRDGTIEEIGIANKRLTQGRSEQAHFLTSGL
jgi:hypothetical protein